MASDLQLKVVSLKEVVYNDSVDSVTLPTASGEITVLPNHAPLISQLAKGAIRTRAGGGEQKEFAIQGGVMEVTPDSRLTVLLV